ncbi:MAG: ATP-binding cassette domain-containing protein [Chloroflexi bacterium]|nr:ATP-binding cassette domain-containing protein [Chloroflexota bacterium]
MRRRSSRPNQSGETPDVPVKWGRTIRYLRPYWKQMVIAFLALIISSALSLVFPVVIQQVVDSVLVSQNVTLLDQITLLLLVVFIVRAISSWFETYFVNWVGEKVVLDLRLELYSHLQDLSLGFYSKRRVGELTSRLSSDVTQIRSGLTTNINTLVQQLLIVLGSIIVMLVLNWRLTLFVLVMAPLIGGLGAFFGVTLRRASAQVQDELAVALTVATETIQSVREVKSFGREPYERERFTRAVMRAFKIALDILKVRAFVGSLTAFIGFAGLAIILWFGGREALDGRLTGGELIAFLVYGVSIVGGLASLLNLYTQFEQAIGATKRVFELLDIQPEVLDAPDAQTLDRVEGRITFADASFSYDSRQEVLHHIDLEIAPGEILALVGPSGAGKSTIFNLIPRFYDPTSGSVALDGLDLRKITQKSLRDQIAIVPQETLLFGGTIYENIRYGKLEASEAEIIEAAKNANAHNFVMDLPDQYQTIVGERGIRLSGGQRQRVAIARALLKNPRILLLDEATSSLDSESEHEVQEALGRLMQGRTTVIIAHRLSTVRIAHRIAVLEKGSIIELGSHNELIARDGLYAKLYAMQFREELIEDALPSDEEAASQQAQA